MAISRETYGRDPSRLVSKNNPPSWERGGGGWKEVRNANTRRYTRLAMETNESISPCRGANKPGQLLSRTPSLFLPLFNALPPSPTIDDDDYEVRSSSPVRLSVSPLQSVKWQTVPLPSRRSRRGGYNLSGNHPISLPVMRPNRFNQLV